MGIIDTDGVSSLWDKTVTIGRNAVWAPEPMTQIVTNLVIIAVLMLSSAVGFVVGIPIAMAAVVLLLIGVARLIAGWIM